MTNEKELLNRIALLTAENFALTVMSGEMLTQALARTDGDPEQALRDLLMMADQALAKIEFKGLSAEAKTFVQAKIEAAVKTAETYAREKHSLGTPPKQLQ